MSYASVASNNVPSPSTRPHPDPANSSNDTGNKVPGFKEHPSTVTSENRPPPEAAYEDIGESRKKSGKDKKGAGFVEQKSSHMWECFREQLIRPGVAGGVLGVVNVGLLSTLAYRLYTQPNLRNDPKVLGGSLAGALVILGAEGFLAEAYRNTEAGRDEERRAKEEGSALYKHTKEIVLRPQVYGGLLAVVNLGIIGGVSYFAYENWDLPQWDKRIVAATAAGLLSLWAGEGYLAEQYKEKYPKRKQT